uniref:Putative addiction module component, TIGR02574 family n=1 Tax=Candidatus Kentrum sp. DK TaxID=2126562 RepID=A0A450SFB7_9GAMM|nr:MAG: putative addiction module component, TIGR02574 family [Candidatus Kentron sp. DK]
MNPNNLSATNSSVTTRLIADFPLADLPIADRIRLVEDSWDSIATDIATDSASLPMADAKKAELNRRLEAYATDGVKGDLADEVIKDIRSHSKHGKDRT